MIQKIKDLIHIDIPTKEARNTLIGTILMKFGMGGIMTWGQLSIYFFSYFYNLNKDTNLVLGSLLINIAILPVSVCMLTSVKAAQKIGYTKLIRICAFLYPFGIFLSAFTGTLLQFSVFYMVFAIGAFGFASLPIINCLWSHFTHASGKVTGIAFFVNGMSSFFISILAVYIINPENKPATVEYNYDNINVENPEKTNEVQLLLFDESVSQNVPKCLFILSFLYFAFTFGGSLLVTHKHQQEENLIKKNNTNIGIQEQIVQGKKRTSVPNNEDIEDIELADLSISPEQQIIKEKYIKSHSDIDENQFQDLTLKKAIKSTPFLIICGVTFIISLFSMFLHINFKPFLIQEINNDHYLTYLGGAGILVGSVSNLVWGVIADKVEFKKIYLVTTIAYAFFSTTFSYISHNQILLFIYYCIISILNSGLITLVAPALMTYFGVKIGQEIYPFKTLPFFGSLLVIPIFNYWAIQSANYEEILFILGVLNLISIRLAYKLKSKYDWSQQEK